MKGIVMQPVSDIVGLLEYRGRRLYAGEPVSQLEHALQAAHQAEQAGAPDWLVIAALLHDVGHLVDEPAGADGPHELLGARLVAPLFGRPIARVIALHVRAKRYLCAVDSAYAAGLSPASIRSLARQGGPLSPDEVDLFERQPYHRDALQLRRWDEAAKVTGKPAPPLAAHRARLEVAYRRAAARD
jgi:predicted HD phosphohydrolase